MRMFRRVKRHWRPVVVLALVTFLSSLGTPPSRAAELLEVTVGLGAYPVQVYEGQRVSFWLMADNIGYHTYDGLEVYHRLPAGFAQPITDGGAVISATNTVSWTTRLAAGESQVFRYSAKAIRSGVIENRVYKACLAGVCSVQRDTVGISVYTPEPHVTWVEPPAAGKIYPRDHDARISIAGIGSTYVMTLTLDGITTPVHTKRVVRTFPDFNDREACLFGVDEDSRCARWPASLRRYVPSNYALFVTVYRRDGKATTSFTRFRTTFSR
jgi:hypothetical protein